MDGRNLVHIEITPDDEGSGRVVGNWEVNFLFARESRHNPRARALIGVDLSFVGARAAHHGAKAITW
jgi:hypothetical protein